MSLPLKPIYATAADVPLAHQIAAVERELRYRRTVYPRSIARGKMTRQTATEEVLRMEAVLATLLRLRAGGQSPQRQESA